LAFIQINQMIRVLKTFLLLWLMAALPIQGLAAVAQSSCDPAHHASSWPTVALPHQHGQEAATLHEHTHPGLESTAGMHHLHTASMSTPLDEARQVHKGSSCSACAACCFGAAAPPSVMSWNPAPTSAEVAFDFHPLLFTGHIPPGLERPPRHFFA